MEKFLTNNMHAIELTGDYTPEIPEKSFNRSSYLKQTHQ